MNKGKLEEIKPTAKPFFNFFYYPAKKECVWPYNMRFIIGLGLIEKLNFKLKH